MAVNALQPEVQRFLADHVSSVAQLELLLLLRTAPERAWSVSEISEKMRVDASWTIAQLKVLGEHGMIDIVPDPPSYRYQPRSAQIERDIGAVAEAYLLQRVSVIEFIYSRPSASWREFADAFRLRKGPRDG